jgi:hypothetical protein
MLKNKETHPTYGMVGFSRRTCGGGGLNLFGSSIRHSQFIALEIKRAVKYRDLSHDWIMGEEELIEVELSPNQFAELLTSMNVGDGVPCTIRHVNRVDAGQCPEVAVRQQITNEFQNYIAKASEEAEQILAEVTTLFGDKANIGKKERAEILKNLEMLVAGIKNNVPYVHKQFNEAMDKTVTEAKAEVEAFVEGKVRSLGIEALQSEVAKALTATTESPILALPSEVS